MKQAISRSAASDATQRVIAALAALFAAGTATHAAEPAISSTPVLEDRYPERRISFPGNVTSLADVTYSSLTGFRPLTLDLYMPTAASTPRPLVIYLHGGGWQAGHTRHSGAFENWPGVLASIAARGYVVASVEYRLSSEAPFPAAVQDVKAAIQWLRSNADKYGIDKSKAVAWGGSAGGQLAALVGASCGAEALKPASSDLNQRPEPGAATNPAARTQPTRNIESDCVQGVVAWYGVFDFAQMMRRASQPGRPRGPEYRYLDCSAEKCADAKVAAASAITYVDKMDPPVLMIHGVNDQTVPIEQSRTYLAALRAKGVAAELLEIPDVDHSFVGQSPDVTRAASLQALGRSIAFIEKTMPPR